MYAAQFQVQQLDLPVWLWPSSSGTIDTRLIAVYLARPRLRRNQATYCPPNGIFRRRRSIE